MPDATPITLDDLIAHVHAQQRDGDPLRGLADAVVVAERLGDQADHLIGHFVDEARRAGASWTEIGRSMGVTKQAAQKRFVPSAGEGLLFERFTDTARAAIAGANDAAREMANAEVGTEHLLLGVLRGPAGLGGEALKAAGVTFEQARAAAVAAGAPTVAAPPKRIPFGSLAKKVLQLAVREALRLGHAHVGTEHLVLAIMGESEGVGAAVLRDLGVDAEEIRAWITAHAED